MMFDRASSLVAMLLLCVQTALSIAPPGAAICIRTLVDRWQTAAVEADVCACCCRERASDNDSSAPRPAMPHCPPESGCCVSVPVFDRPAPPLALPLDDAPVAWAPVLVTWLPAACDIPAAEAGDAPPEHPPPAFAAELRSIRLVI